MEPVQNSWGSWGLKKFILVFVSLVFLIFLWQWISSPMVVTVTGSGEVVVPATNATLSFTLSSSDDSAPNAISSVQAKAESFRSFLKSKGISDEDIAQSQVTAVPLSLVTAGSAGFQATVTMAAKTTHVSDISNLISDLYTNGALVVSQPILSVENQDELSQKALDEALKNARSEAWKMSLKNWKFIKKVVSITQVSSPSTSTATTRPDTLTGTNDALASQNGVFKIVKAVSVSYKMW